jgi:hypothetical protein
MVFNLETLIALSSLALGILSLAFMFVKWNSSQIHGRITRLENEMDKKIDTVRAEAKNDISVAFEIIKDMIREIREDVRWLMQTSKKE